MLGSGQQALISMIVHIIFIVISWQALQAVKIEKIIKANHVFQTRVLYILISIVIGSTVANFFLDYLFWSQQLPHLF